MMSRSSPLLMFTFTDRAQYTILPLRSLTSLWFAEFSVPCLTNFAHSLGAVHKHGKEIAAFVIVYCCYGTRLENLTILGLMPETVSI